MKHWLRNSFVAGLVLVAPLVITVVALRIVFGWLLGLVDPIVAATQLTALTGNNELVAQLLALGVLLGIIVLIGAVTQWGLGRRLFGELDRLIGLIPFVRVIYMSVRQVSDSLTSSESRFETTVLVEYPREGVYSIGFVTDESPDPVQAATGPAYNVYLPFSPNPTNGQLAMVPEDQVTEIDMAPRQGLRLLVTTGLAESTDDIDEMEQYVDADLDELK